MKRKLYRIVGHVELNPKEFVDTAAEIRRRR